MATLLRRRGSKRGWGNSVAATGWGESTFAEMAWDKARSAATRWGVLGAMLGSVVAIIAFAPAAWLASAVASATGERLLLTEARGTVWSGSAVPVLTGGPGSRDASALPGRLEWAVRIKGLGLELRAKHDCCLNGAVAVQYRPGLGSSTIKMEQPQNGGIGQWPSAWLAGIGTPFNTLQLGGSIRITTPGFTVETAQGRAMMNGRLDIDFINASSRMSTLDSLGSYRMTLAGGGNNGAPTMTLTTLEGALQLTGNGTWGAGKVRFLGEARATVPDDAALSNLLNIIGKRDGARSVISIG